MKHVLGLLAIASLLVTIGVVRFGHSQPATAASGCGAGSLGGAYSFQIWDRLVHPGPDGSPVVTADIVEGGIGTFDGRGGITYVWEGSFNGAAQFGPENRTGQYSVQPNCTGSFTVNYVASDTCCTNHYDFVIVSGGRELTIFQRDPGTVSAGRAVKQSSDQ